MAKEFKRITIEDAHFYKLLDRDKLSSEEICRKAVAFTLTPDPDSPGWELVNYYQDSPLDKNGYMVPTEYVYVLVNRSMPDMVKIGMTIREVEERAKEISGATGVPTPWVPVFSFKCFNSYKLEQEIHEHLDAVRVAGNREMFYMHSKDAIDTVKKLGDKYTISPL
jgi:hypothetical protein